MSFGASVGDVTTLIQLAWKTVQDTRKARGEHDELTLQVSGFLTILCRLRQEFEGPGSLFNKDGATCKQELESIITGCQLVLTTLDQKMERYDALGEHEENVKSLWQRFRFGNGQVLDLAGLRGKLTYYTSVISPLLSVGSTGGVEKQMDEAGGDLKDIKSSVNAITARLLSECNQGGSALTAYSHDDRAVWKEFRRELIKDGFSSAVLKKHETVIKAYITELKSRGLHDDEDS